MRELKLIDRSQPQTLVIGSILLYLNAAFTLFEMLFVGISPLLLLVSVVLPVVGAYGIANSKRLGYYLAVAAAAIPLVTYLYFGILGGLGTILSSGIIIIIFAIVPFALLLHPMSREYQRVWFH
jgi:uncharacterized membrane protein (DUF2068 family)